MHETPPASVSLTDRIAAEIRGEILRGRYRAGDRLPSERELADRFDTHRGAVREALKKLEQLGIAEIRRGGARALPIQEASLDVLRHLIELENPPDPALFDQIFEVFGGMFALSERLAAERADDDERQRAAKIFERLLGDELSALEEHGLIQELSDLFVMASRNSVMPIVRRGLYTATLDDMARKEDLLRPAQSERNPLLRRFARSFAAADGPGTFNAAFELVQSVRRNAVAQLTAERDALNSPRPVGATQR